MSNSTNHNDIKVIFFDMGGVVLDSPLEAIKKYSLELQLPENYINFVISSWGNEGPFQKFERGEIQLDLFLKSFNESLNSPIFRTNYMSIHPGQEVKENVVIDGKHIYNMMINVVSNPNFEMVKAIKYLKGFRKFKIIALTNDFKNLNQTNGFTELLKIFDDVIHSHEIGMRKPEKRIYEYACKKSKVHFSETVFLDDIGGNLKTAHELGMKTILVKPGKTHEALKKLGQIINVEIVKHISQTSKL